MGKKRNVKGRKNPAFAEAVILMFRDSLVSIDEMTEQTPEKEYDEKTGRTTAKYRKLPKDCTAIDSVYGHTLFKDERLFRHLDRIAFALDEFGDEFRSEEGTSVTNLRVDRKNRVWGSEIAVLSLAYLAIAAGLAEWTQARSEWNSNEDRMPKIRFIKQEKTDEQQTGLSHEPSAKEKFINESPLA